MNTLSDLIDADLEISVIGSFSRIGPAIRRRARRLVSAER